MISNTTIDSNIPDPPPTDVRPDQTAIDRRTFHLFPNKDSLYLYGVASGVFAEINHATSQLLKLCASYDWDEVDKLVKGHNSSWKSGDSQRVLNPLIDEGHFKFTPISKAEQAAGLDILWRHRPRRLQLLMAQHCNLKCVYCYEEFNGSNARNRLMSKEMAKAAVDYLVHRSGSRKELQITFFGGEPLLNKKVLEQVVAYCKEIEGETEKTFVFELITNGTLLDAHTLSFILKHKFLLMISMDGYRGMHEHNRPSVSGSPSFDLVLANAKRADRAYKASGTGLPVKIRANLTHEHHDLKRVVRFLEAEGFTTIGVAAIDELPWYDGLGHGCSSDDLDQIAAQGRELLENGIQAHIDGSRCSPYESRLVRKALTEIIASSHIRGLGCGVGRNTNIVDTNGDIYPCHRYGDMGMYTIGNVKEMKLNYKLMKDYYEKVNVASSTKCATCWGRNICGGPCAWEVSNPNGTVLEPDDDNCRRVLKGIEGTLILRQRLLSEAPHLVREDPGACGTSCGC